MFRSNRILFLLLSFCLSACVTTQDNKMTVSGTPDTAPPKYRNAFAVRSINGACNVSAAGIKPLVCVEAPVSPESIKDALEKSLAANGYLASGTPKYYIDMDIEEARLPMLAVDVEVTTTVTYKVSGDGVVKTYPIKSTGTAQFSENLVGAVRGRNAIMYSLKQNFTQFLQALR